MLPDHRLDFPIYSHDLKIPAGSDYVLPNKDKIGIGPPCGTEIYKVFASESEIDVEQLAMTRGQAKGVMTGIEKLIQNSYGAARGATPVNAENADATTFNYVFQINPKP